jgi:hypothetical protein
MNFWRLKIVAVDEATADAQCGSLDRLQSALPASQVFTPMPE